VARTHTSIGLSSWYVFGHKRKALTTRAHLTSACLSAALVIIRPERRSLRYWSDTVSYIYWGYEYSDVL
jgi:hypothetical protein